VCSIGFISQSILLPNWFVKKRGLAMGLAMAGIGVGMQLFVPITQHIISRFGWRAAYCFLAAVALGVVIPLNAAFQRRRPEEIGQHPDGETMPSMVSRVPAEKETQRTAHVDAASAGWTLKSSLRTRPFWFMFVTFFFIPLAVQGTFTHQVAHVVDKGFSAARGAFFFGLAGIMGSVGKILFGCLSDRIGREKAFSIGIGCAFLGVLSLMGLGRHSDGLLYGYAFFFGLGYGAIAPIFPARAADLFQGPHFGKIYGFLSIAAGLGGATGTWLSGKIFDLTKSYHIAFLVVLSALILIVILFWFTSPVGLNRDNP
jgi:MFS family permease